MPINETPKDKERERKFGAYLATLWRCAMAELPQFYEIDFAAVRDRKVLSMVEVKCRKYEMHHFKTCILSMHKYAALRRVIRIHPDITAIFAVRWLDGDGYFVVGEEDELDLEWEGRTDRGSQSDLEPCVKIPIDLFQKLGAK